jgi:tetratricopeptide (TPR) repeat protein
MVMISSLRFSSAATLLALFLALGPLSAAQGAGPKPEAAIVAFGLFGDQTVFESEAKGAAKIMAARFGGNHVIVRANTTAREDATPETLAAALEAAGAGLDPDNDILFLLLTSHGNQSGVALETPKHQGILSPLDLVALLEKAPLRHRVVIISACYSGIFIPLLADPDTLIITAADANHPSFGCQNGADWTYFGDAFFNVALRRTANLRDAFALASQVVRKHELQSGYDPSNPQFGGGENVERMLAGVPVEGPQKTPDPRFATVHLERGDAYSGLGNIERALAEYSEAIRFDPQSAFAYAKRGVADSAKGDGEAALADTNKAVTLDPKLAFAYNSRGRVYYAMGDKDHAIADYDQAIRLDPKRPALYYNRAVAYVAKGDNDRAIADYSAAVKLDPSYYIAYNNRGLAYRAKGDNDHAIAGFSQAIKIEPRFLTAYENRAVAYRAKGDGARAMADFNQASRLRAMSGGH